MKKITFDEEELYAIAVFNPDTRTGTADAMEEVLPLLKDDTEMHALLMNIVKKLRKIPDDVFNNLELEEYREEIESAAVGDSMGSSVEDQEKGEGT